MTDHVELVEADSLVCYLAVLVLATALTTELLGLPGIMAKECEFDLQRANFDKMNKMLKAAQGLGQHFQLSTVCSHPVCSHPQWYGPWLSRMQLLTAEWVPRRWVPRSIKDIVKSMSTLDVFKLAISVFVITAQVWNKEDAEYDDESNNLGLEYIPHYICYNAGCIIDSTQALCRGCSIRVMPGTRVLFLHPAVVVLEEQDLVDQASIDQFHKKLLAEHHIKLSTVPGSFLANVRQLKYDIKREKGKPLSATIAPILKATRFADPDPSFADTCIRPLEPSIRPQRFWLKRQREPSL